LVPTRGSGREVKEREGQATSSLVVGSSGGARSVGAHGVLCVVVAGGLSVGSVGRKGLGSAAIFEMGVAAKDRARVDGCG